MAATARDPRVLRALELLRSPAERVALDHPELVRAAITEGLVLEEAIAADPAAWPELSPVAGDADAMRALGALGQPAEIVAIARLPEPPAAVAPGSLVLAGVHDPGNVGGCIRSAAAFDSPTVAVTPDTASPFGRKALRASRGAALRPGLVKPILSLADIDVPLAAAVPRHGEPPEAAAGHAIVLGNEHTGLTPGQIAACDLAITIPARGFESLNVAAAAAILLWELASRR